ncbi:hypothetical protein NA57DRAFT_73836 [Rhizodiscina lignyota]|uniref:CHAT domain-containing protein n=1 Tax=Rhizodiscina lignyota TaxID=1504668 RepID=A0A9P4M713_9PEZI|nr:hypothetical protein NA57DRAFT_73836 [Rhizodiscina lignyota]
MSSASRNTIQIISTSADKSHQATENSNTTRRCWYVDVVPPSPAKPHTVLLSDPFNEEQNSECSWYLNKYVQHEPFSERRAKEALQQLKTYGTRLIQDLELRDVVEKLSKSGEPITISVANNDPEVWEVNGLELIIVRDSQSDVPATNSPQLDLVGHQINILLVLARDLRREVSLREEINPHLAFGVLFSLKNELRKRNTPIQLNINIVRPGSFEALESHLKETENQHGKGFFHIVHFDLHGIISTDSQANLLFNSSSPSDFVTQPEPVEKVAGILHQFGITSVVLNACDSANTSRGVEANASDQFINQGVMNVLAISFKITSTAAEVFLHSFYHSLILGGHGFYSAAQRGRRALRADICRDARFNLKRDLNDSFVPVTYTSGNESKFQIPNSITASETEDSSIRTKTKQIWTSALESQLLAEKLIGRELDLLRLEKKLIAEKCLHLSGRAGVGKTSLLIHAIEIWMGTSFFEVFVGITFPPLDFNNYKSPIFASFDDFLQAYINELPLQSADKEELSKESPPISEPAPVYFTRRIHHLLSTVNSLLVFDSLHTLYVGMKISDEIDKLVSDINLFMATLLTFSREVANEKKLYIIFSSRCNKVLHPELVKGVKWDFSDGQFDVESLPLSASMQLARSAISNLAPKSPELADGDMAELELLLGLLDGNPSAILHVMQGKSATQSWAEYRRQVHLGILPPLGEDKNEPVYGEIGRFVGRLSEEVISGLIYYSLFWKEGMPLTSTIAELHLLGLMSFTETTVHSLNFTADRGFIDWKRAGDDAEIPWIHPLMTLCARSYAQEYAQNQTNVATSPTEVISSAVLAALGQSYSILIPEDKIVAINKVPQLFLTSVEKHSMKRFISVYLKGYNYNDAFSNWAKESANLETCIAICLRNPPSSIDQLPLDFFGQCVSGIRMTGSPAEISLFSKLFVEFFQLVISINKGLAFGPDDDSQRFSLVMSTCLAAMYNSELLQKEKFSEYSQLAVDIIRASEKEFGPYQNHRVQYMKGLALRYRGMSLITEGKAEAANEYFQEMLDLEGGLLQEPEKLAFGFTKDQVDDVIQNLGLTGEEAATKEEQLKNMASGSYWTTYMKSRRNIMRVTTLPAMAEKEGDSVLSSRAFRGILAKASAGMKQVLEQGEAMGMQGIEQDTRWWPEGVDLNYYVRRQADTTEKLRAFEDAVNSGDSARVQKLQSEMFMQSLKTLDMEEILWKLVNMLKGDKGEVTGEQNQEIAQSALSNAIDIATTRGDDPNAIEALKIWKELPSTRMSGIQFTTREVERVQKFMKLQLEGASSMQVSPSRRADIQLKHAQLMMSYEQALFSGNVDETRDCLNGLEEFIQLPETGHYGALYDDEWFHNARGRLESLDQFAEASIKWNEHMSENNFQAALDIISEFEKGLDPAIAMDARLVRSEVLGEMELTAVKNWLSMTLQQLPVNPHKAGYRKTSEDLETISNYLHQSDRIASTEKGRELIDTVASKLAVVSLLNDMTPEEPEPRRFVLM